MQLLALLQGAAGGDARADTEATVTAIKLKAQAVAQSLCTSRAYVMLPPGWQAHQDPKSGRTYYVYTVTQATQWDPPQV